MRFILEEKQRNLFKIFLYFLIQCEQLVYQQWEILLLLLIKKINLPIYSILAFDNRSVEETNIIGQKLTKEMSFQKISISYSDNIFLFLIFMICLAFSRCHQGIGFTKLKINNY